MFCPSCGEKIPESSRFCMKCGFKIPSEFVEKTNTSELSTWNAQPPLEFTIDGIPLSFDANIREFTKRRKEFLAGIEPLIFQTQYEVNQSVRSLTRDNIDDCLDIFLSFKGVVAEQLISLIHKGLLAEGIYTLTKENVASLYQNTATDFENEYERLEEEYLEIAANESQLAEYKAIKRRGRSYWVGGGFGIKGAVRGAVTAGAMNFGTNILRGIGDSIVDSKDKQRIYEKKLELLRSRPWTEVFARMLYSEAGCGFEIFARILADNQRLVFPSLDLGLAQVYFENAGKVDDREETIRLLVKSMEAYPFAPRCGIRLVTVMDGEDDEALSVFEYFASEYEQIRLTMTLHKQFLHLLEAMSGSDNALLDNKIAAIENRLALVEEKAARHPSFQANQEFMVSSLQRRLTELRKKRFTSADGITHTSAGDADSYEREKPRFEQYKTFFEKKIGGFDEQVGVLRKAQAEDFESSFIQGYFKRLDERLAACAELRKAYAGSFGDYLSRQFRGDDFEEIRSMIPDAVQAELARHPLSPIAKNLAGCPVNVDIGLFRTAEVYIFVTDFYTTVLWNSNVREAYWISTAELRDLHVDSKGLHFRGLRAEKDFDECVQFEVQKGQWSDLSEFINMVNRALRQTRSNIEKGLCPACGKELYKNAMFCGHCGYKLQSRGGALV